jgi:hypothetical protein
MTCEFKELAFGESFLQMQNIFEGDIAETSVESKYPVH